MWLSSGPKRPDMRYFLVIVSIAAGAFSCQFAEKSTDYSVKELLSEGNRLLNSPSREQEGERLLLQACNLSGGTDVCTQVYLTLADHFYYTDRCAQALEYYFSALERARTDDVEDIVSKMCQCFEMQKNYFQMKLLVDRLIREGYQSGRMYLLLSRAEEALGQIDRAISICRKLVKGSYPRDIQETAYFRLVRLYESQEKLKAAIQTATEALQKGYNPEYMRWKIKRLKRRLVLRKYR